MEWILLFVVVSLKLQDSQGSNIKVRLADGKSPSEGRVELYHNGQWGTVCDDSWDLNDANVVCRSLGLPNATSAPFEAAFGRGTGPIWMDEVKCVGSESSLFECPHAGLGSSNCDHGEDASISCGYPPVRKFTIKNLTGMIHSPGFPDGMEQANYEWIFKPPVQSPVAALYFESIDLTRINRGKSELSVKNSNNITVLHVENEKRQDNSGWIVQDPWMIRFYSLFTIKHKNGHGGRGMRLRYFIFSGLDNEHSCNSNWKVQVSAGVGAINVSWNSLSQDSNYKYLVMYNATKKEIKNFTMITNATSVRIGYLLTDKVYSIQLVGFSSSKIAAREYSCLKIIRTKPASWRLVGGKRPNEGLIEVDYNDKLGTICALHWDINDAKVACRSMGLPPATYALSRTGQFRVTRRKTWISSFECFGNESSLVDCTHGGWGNLQVWCNRFYYTAGVVCGYPNVTNYDILQVFGVISSPGYPRYMEQAHYIWTFKPPIPRARVVVYFDEMDLNRHDPGVSNLTLTDQNGEQLLFVQNQKKPRFSYLSNRNPKQLTFYSSFTSSRPTKGFRVFYMVLNDSLANVPLKDKWIFSAISTSPYSIKVTWSPFSDKDLTLTGYLITCSLRKGGQNDVFYSIADQNSTVVFVNNLNGYTHYRVQVFAYLKKADTGVIHMYRSKVIDVQTQEGVPVRVPPNITITYKNLQYVHVKWNPIPQEYVHGVLLGYNVYYEAYSFGSRKTTITTTNLHAVLTDLLPAMKYRLQLAGYTAKGDGRIQTLSFISKCGDTIEDRQTGIIPMPSVSSRSWDVECEWTVKQRSQRALIVVIVDVVNLVPWYYPCSRLYISLVNGEGRTVTKFCEKRRLVSLVSYGSAKIRFHSSGASPFKRESAPKATYYVFRKGIDEVSFYPDWKISARSRNSSTINVQWATFPKIEAVHVKFVAVCISKADSTELSTAAANSSRTSVQVGNLKAYTDYKVQVLAFLGNSSNIDWKKEIFRSQMVIVRTLKNDWNPRYPLQHDIDNSVRITVKGLNVLEWNQLYDFKFKTAVAREVTEFCAKDQRCPRPRKRARRSSVFITFTSEQVHLLPGYPVQLAFAYHSDNAIAAVTFYVNFPQDVGMNSTDVLSQSVLLDIVKASANRIGKAINKTILTISVHKGAIPSNAAHKSTSYKAGIIAGSVAAVIFLVLLVAVVFLVLSFRRRGKHSFNKKDDQEPVIEMQHPEMETEREKQPEERGHTNETQGIQDQGQQRTSQDRTQGKQPQEGGTEEEI